MALMGPVPYALSLISAFSICAGTCPKSAAGPLIKTMSPTCSAFSTSLYPVGVCSRAGIILKLRSKRPLGTLQATVTRLAFVAAMKSLTRRRLAPLRISLGLNCGRKVRRRSDAEHAHEGDRHTNNRAPAAASQLLSKTRQRLDDRMRAHLFIEGAIAGVLTFDVLGDQLHQVSGGHALRIGGRLLSVLDRGFDPDVWEVLFQHVRHVNIERIG